MGIQLMVVYFVIGGACYLLPWLVAIVMGNRNVLAIFLLNLFFGWTILGWFGALIWATLREKKESSGHL